MFMYFLLLVYFVKAETNETIYSAPPSDLPIRKIYVHGVPVYVRQMFVSPQRPFSGYRSQRIKRLGFAPPPIVPPIVPPSVPSFQPSIPSFQPSVSASYVPPSQSVASNSYSYSYSPNYSPSSSFSNPAPASPQIIIQPSIIQPPIQPPIQPQQVPINLPQPQPLPLPQPTQPPVVCQPPATNPEPISEPIPEPIPEESHVVYPLPQCYTDRSNFMCCNRTLEDTMYDTFMQLKTSRPQWSSCNIQKIATEVQRNAEQKYGTEFEVIVGIGDYASKSHFYSDLICKIEADGKFILAYAHARQDAEDYDANAENTGNENDGEDRGNVAVPFTGTFTGASPDSTSTEAIPPVEPTQTAETSQSYVPESTTQQTEPTQSTSQSYTSSEENRVASNDFNTGSQQPGTSPSYSGNEGTPAISTNSQQSETTQPYSGNSDNSINYRNRRTSIHGIHRNHFWSI